jgi:hypothetical protein
MAGLANDGIDGVWKGRISTDRTTSLPIRLSVRNGTYSVRYPTLECSGTWRLTDETDGSATFQQTLPNDPQDKCTNVEQTIEVFRIASNRLQIFLFFHGDLFLGRGTLTCPACPTVGGWTTQLTLSRIVCLNVTTDEQVVIQGDDATWNCEDSGLRVRPDDTIRQIITGTAK